jgi:hypothetical protein
VLLYQDFDIGLDTAFDSFAAQLDNLASGLPGSCGINEVKPTLGSI